MYKKRLLELGLKAGCKGFEYLNYAIEIFEPLMKTMDVYKKVAEHYNDTVSRTERAMRHSLEFHSESGEDKDITVGNFIAKYKILWED